MILRLKRGAEAERGVQLPISMRQTTSRLTNRVPPYKEQTASRRSVENREVATFTTLPHSFEPRSRLFGSHLARSQAGTTSVHGCYPSRRPLLPYASRRNAPTRAG